MAVGTDPSCVLLTPFADGPFSKGPLKSWSVTERGSGSVPDIAVDMAPASISADLPTGIKRVEDGFVVSFAKLARFHVCFRNRSITAFDIDPATTPAALIHLLYDHVAPRLLAHLGQLVLHASAVEIAGEVAIFLGETGAGKSTLAAGLHRAGYRLLGDDAVIISQSAGRFLAEPVYPSLRLYPDSISRLLEAGAEVSEMAHYSDKQRVELALLGATPAEPLPIASIFFLSGEPGVTKPAAHHPSPSQTCINLLEQSFSLDPSDPACAARRLALASKLTEEVRAYEIEYPREYDRLGEVHALIGRCLVQPEPDDRAD